MRAPLIVAATGLALIALAAPASAETTASVSNGTLDHKAHGRLTHPVVTVRNVDTGGALTLRPRP